MYVFRIYIHSRHVLLFFSFLRSFIRSFVPGPRRADGFNSTAGTTCTVCLLRGVQLWTAHVGDSRAVLSDGHQAITLTKDHKAYGATPLESLVKSRTLVEGAAGHLRARVHGSVASYLTYADVRNSDV